jgi:uncharacterized membrane protein (UPF0136 family)
VSLTLLWLLIAILWLSILIYAIGVCIASIVSYITVRSLILLVSGLMSSIILVIAWYYSFINPVVGFGISFAIALILTIIFTIRFFKKRSFIPTGLIALLNLVAAITFAISLTYLYILSAGFGSALSSD